MMLRDDVHNRGAQHFLGMVEAHAVQNTCPSVMTGGEKFVVAERRHHLDLI